MPRCIACPTTRGAAVASTLPAQVGQGIAWGRAEAWVADLMATTYAISEDEWRARHLRWFVDFTVALARAQMPNQLFSAIGTGKVATSPPFGHRLNQPCPYGIHQVSQSTTEVGDFFAHRSNEQVHLMTALTAIQEATGLDVSDMVQSAGEGLWNYAWKPGANGPLEIYPAGFANSNTRFRPAPPFPRA